MKKIWTACVLLAVFGAGCPLFGQVDKIDKVIKESGYTTENGVVTANDGGDKSKGFVDSALADASNMIQTANGWAYASHWTKKWKVNPDGSITEVKETKHEGWLNASGNPSGPPTGTPGTPAPADPSVPSTPSTPSTPSSTPLTNSGSTSTVNDPPAAPAGPGMDPAPIQIATSTPPSAVILTIRDQISNNDQTFNNTIDAATRAVGIPEDTRAKFTLDIGSNFDTDKLKIEVVDHEGLKEYPFSQSFHHLFRTPSQDKYSVKVLYPDPVTHAMTPVLYVQVPVYGLNFRRSTMENSSRGQIGAVAPSGPTAPTGPVAPVNQPPADSSMQTNGIDSAQQQANNDLNDLYTNPTNPPQVQP